MTGETYTVWFHDLALAEAFKKALDWSSSFIVESREFPMQGWLVIIRLGNCLTAEFMRGFERGWKAKACAPSSQRS